MLKFLAFFFTLIIPVSLLAQTGSEVKIVPRISDVFHTVGDSKINVRLYQYGDKQDIVFINLHDNEATSVEATKELLETHGGLLIKIENKGKRNIDFRLQGRTYRFDPNRIFSRVGVELSLKRFGNSSAKAIAEVTTFGQKILKLVPGKAHCVVALHNNADKGFSVMDYVPGNEKAGDAKEINIVSSEDADDFFLTTDSRLFHLLSEKKYNVVWQNNSTVTQDGSLSVYFGEKNIPYINCETEHGKVVQYRSMMASIPDCVEQFRKK